ncbi:MAG: lamin tail domain-containing protein [Nanoarchaeota archaeon]|nr:lamin tail domain-containing protein [Nanoarchaeota archaeon]
MRIVKKLFLVFGISLILLNFVSAEILINEIMYNPEGDDNNKEFIEIFSDSFVNLTDYIIQDSSSSDILEPMQISDNSYSLIVEENFNYTGINASVYSVGATIGNNLNNEEDIIIFKDNNSNILDAVHYYSDWGANGNGMSLCKINNLFQECIPTPGSLNSNSLDYSNIKINEFLPDPEGYDDASIPNGEWVELYNSAGHSIDLEGLILNDDYGNGLEISDTNTLSSNTTINPNSYLTIYRNGDGTLELNNDGDTVKLLYENIIIDQVSYPSSTEGLSWSKTSEGFWIQTIPTPCQQNNYEEPDHSSDLKIEQIYLGSDDKSNFGDMLRVEVNIYKGDTSKESIQLYVKDINGEEISKRSKFNVYSTFTNYSLTIPVQLFPNCNRNFPDGDYIMYLTGLDETDEMEFEIKDITTSLCETVTTTSSSYKDYHFEFLEVPYEIFQNSLTKLKIVNNATTSKKFEVWSYVYRGSKSYSGDREENKREIEVPWDSSINVNLENYLDSDTETGEYKLKVKIQKEDRVTPDEFTFDVYIIGSEEGSLEEFPSFLAKGLNGLSNITGNVIYASSDIKAKELGIYFFCAVLIILVIYLIITKFL